MTARFSPIGLDWSGATACAVQLRRAKKGWAIHAALRAPVGPLTDAESAIRLHRVLWRHGFEGSDTVLTLPTRGVAATTSATLSLPPRASGAPVDQLARTEMARVAGRSPEALELDLWEIPAPRRAATGWHVLAVAAPGAEIASRVELFEDAGLRVIAADARAPALCRATESLHSPGADITIIVELAWDAAHLVAATSDAPVFERRIDELAISTLAASVLGVSDERALAQRFAAVAASTDQDRRAAPDTAAKLRRLVDALRAGVRDEIALSASYLSHQFDRHITRVILAAPAPFLEQLEAPSPLESLRVSDWSTLSISASDGPEQLATPGALLAAVGAALHPGAARGKAAA